MVKGFWPLVGLVIIAISMGLSLWVIYTVSDIIWKLLFRLGN